MVARLSDSVIEIEADRPGFLCVRSATAMAVAHLLLQLSAGVNGASRNRMLIPATLSILQLIHLAGAVGFFFIPICCCSLFVCHFFCLVLFFYLIILIQHCRGEKPDFIIGSGLLVCA